MSWVQPYLDCSLSGNPSYESGYVATSSYSKTTSTVAGFDRQEENIRLAMGFDSVGAMQGDEPSGLCGEVPPFHLLDSSRIRRLKGGGVGCPLCPKVSRDKFNLRDHYMASHSGEKPLSCSLCPYKCIRKKDLTLHYRSKHINQLEPSDPLLGVSRDSLTDQYA